MNGYGLYSDVPSTFKINFNFSEVDSGFESTFKLKTGLYKINDDAIRVEKFNLTTSIFSLPFVGKEFYLETPEPPPPPNTHKVEGRVYNYQGNPVSRKVCVFSKTTDQFLGTATSSAVDGFYSIAFTSSDPVYVVCFPNVNEDINAKIYDRIVPVSV